MLNCAETAALLRQWDRILVLSHANPDGDTLGSAAALMRGLTALGKKVSFRCADEIAPKFQPLFEGLVLSQEPPEHIVTVDVADIALLGGIRQEFEGKVDLAIDHHDSHRDFARESWVEGDSAAAAEMIWLLLKELGVNIDPAMAACVFTGLTTDTGCFRYRNTTPRTHRIAAETMDAGADAGEINRVHFETTTRAIVEAERRVMESMTFFCGGKCAMIRVPQSVYQETGVKESDLDGRVSSLPRQIEGVLLGVTLKEKANGDVKVSVRSNPPANAAKLAEKFGGGGHAGAAGCTFRGASMEEAAEKLAAACEEYLKELGVRS